MLPPGLVDSRSLMRSSKSPKAALLAFALVLYALMSYGGIRSPDGEIEFRLGESLATTGSFAVPHELENWPGFGVARGRDGRLYSIFGPAQPLLLAPFIQLGRWLERTRWYEAPGLTISPSHYVKGGFADVLNHRRPSDPRPHALRMVASLMNVIVGALGAMVFWCIVARMTRSSASATAMAVLYAFGTLAWPYAGADFSEPLATLWALCSFYGLVALDPRFAGAPPRRPSLTAFLSGLALGASVATHITAMLFVPFWALYVVGSRVLGPQPPRGGRAEVLTFAAGLAIVIALIGAYDVMRFGNPFETGRGVDPELSRRMSYGSFVAPWRGLYGLLVGSGKGILIFSPAVLLGLACWPGFHRRHPWLSASLALAFGARLVFIASRSDWHGGFCLGPRYLVMLIPFLLLPAAPWVHEQIVQRRRWGLALFSAIVFLCVAQQLAFCLGEVMSYYHHIRIEFVNRQGLDLFLGDRIYLNWLFSPALHLLEGERGPALLQGIPLGNLALWAWMTAATGALCLAGFGWLARAGREGAITPPAGRRGAAGGRRGRRSRGTTEGTTGDAGR